VWPDTYHSEGDFNFELRQESENEIKQTEAIEEWTDTPLTLDRDLDVWTDPLDFAFCDLQTK
jgi:hypothetical protein